MPRAASRQVVAGMDLAGPALRQGRRREEADARVARRGGAHDRGGAVGRAVVHHEDLDRHAPCCERAASRARADLRLLVAGRDQDRDEACRVRARGAGWRAGWRGWWRRGAPGRRRGRAPGGRGSVTRHAAPAAARARARGRSGARRGRREPAPGVVDPADPGAPLRASDAEARRVAALHIGAQAVERRRESASSGRGGPPGRGSARSSRRRGSGGRRR